MRNALLSVFSWFFPLTLAFVTTPILVRGLGTEGYGIYALILGFISYAFTTGIGKITAKYIPEYRAADEPELLRQAVSAAFWLTLTIGIIEASVLALLTPTIVKSALLLDTTQHPDVVSAFYLACIAGLILMVSQVFQFVLQGLHRFDLFALLTNLSGLLMNVGNIYLVLTGRGYYAIFLWNVIVSGAVGLLFYHRSKRLLPELSLRPSFDRSTLKTVARYVGSIIVYQSFTSLLFVFERAWIVRKFGADSLTFYVLPLMLALYMHGFLGSFVQVLFPVVNEMISDRERLIALYKKSTRVILLLIVFIVGSYVSWGKLFLGLWIGPEFAQRSYILLILLSTAFGLNAISMIVWLLAETFRRPGINAFSSGLWTCVAIPLMVLATIYEKIEGIAAARLIGVMCTIPIIFFVERRTLGSSFFRFWAGILLKAGISVSVMVAISFLLIPVLPVNWIATNIGSMCEYFRILPLYLAHRIHRRDRAK